MSKPYVAKSLISAQREVRALRKQRKELNRLLDKGWQNQKALARLAAKTPQFSNPLDAWEAEKLRDEILRGIK